MHKIHGDKAQMLTERMAFKAMGLNEIESAVLGKALGDVTFDAQRMCYLYKWLMMKQIVNFVFTFHLFFFFFSVEQNFLWIPLG